MTHALLTPEAHGPMRVRTDRGADLGDAVMSSLVVPAEFRQVQDDYLILFRQNQERDGFMALALFGFEAGENLYLDGDRWDAGYRPLAMAIQPFLIGGAPDGSGPRQVHVDLASPRIARGGEGVRVFDEHGRPSPYLETVIDQLGALDEGYRASAAFFAALERHALLEPLSVDVTLADGARNRLVGYHVIDEDRLRSLDSAALGELHAEGHLLPIFMAVASIGNLGALVQRRNRRMGHG
jgi:hypothetical protein